VPAEIARVPVAGTTRPGGLLRLATRLNDHDTFLTGTLRLTTGKIPVHILTFDDATFLRPVDAAEPVPSSARWQGVLHISHGLRDHDVPPDLIDTATQRRRDLTALTGPELRYALTFLHEASTTDIRRQRINAIVDAMPPVHRTDEAANPQLDHGSTSTSETGLQRDSL
jgi:hypothetical protein